MNKWYFYFTTFAAVCTALITLWAGLPNHGGFAMASEIGTKPDTQSTKVYQKPSDEKIRDSLTDLQFQVTQRDGTERAFSNEFWNHDKPGIYVDVVTGEPLFSSVHKFKSGTGWPSFYQPLVAANVIEKRDMSHFMVRVEVRSKFGDSHLGHVFTDGPAPTGLRYCINSASLRFVPVDRLEAEGYGRFMKLFEAQPSR